MTDLSALAAGFGFTAAALTDASPTRAPDGPVHPQAQALLDDPKEVLPEARSVMVLALPYETYRQRPGEASVDAYYVAGNTAHQRTAELARALTEAGIRAVPTAKLRMKPLCVRAGLGKMGRNTLIAIKGMGSRLSLQTIVTDCPAEAPHAADSGPDGACLHCRACVDACPTGALQGDGRLDVTRCLRAQPESEALPEEMRPLIGASMLGCDICQRVCPRNARSRVADMPEDLDRALRLDRILSGDYKELIPFLGSNNARKMRLMSRACVVAANLDRRDLLPLIEKLAGSEGAVGVHARWAIRKLLV